jgi:hypothetical protein
VQLSASATLRPARRFCSTTLRASATIRREAANRHARRRADRDLVGIEQADEHAEQRAGDSGSIGAIAR